MTKVLTFLLRLIAHLPFRVLFIISDCMYPLVKTFYRRSVVRENLISSFPEKSLHEIKVIERRFYHFLCDLFMEIIKGYAMSREEMMEHMVFSGLDQPREGFANGKDDLFCYLGHFGNWEWAASLQYWTDYCKCAQIYHPLYNKTMDKFFLDLRTKYQGECIPMKTAARTLIKRRAEGVKILCGFISDQLPKWENIHHFTPFLNHDTAVFTGGEQLGKRLDAMMYYGRVTRPRRGYYTFEFIPICHDSKDVPDFDITDRYMTLLEEDIQQYPELWLWTHKRWRRTKEEWLRREGR